MNEQRVASFLALAEEDLAACKQLMRQYPRQCAFYLEQAAEKLLKAVLTVEAIVFTASHHQLGALAALLPEEHLWRADLMAFDRFSSYATAFRYPTPGGGMPRLPGRDELERGWREVRAVAAEIKDWSIERLAEKAGKGRGR
ncbi:MAG TPA: HEPN domain-containing protein [Alphaproteobacteria bacterium]|nr:HEPN domain-containing protein [Alphaproteobacteria bacterium]